MSFNNDKVEINKTKIELLDTDVRLIEVTSISTSSNQLVVT